MSIQFFLINRNKSNPLGRKTSISAGFLLAMVLVGGLASESVLGSTRFVAIGGDNAGNDCLDENDPCATIQHAIDMAMASPGDTVQVAPGVYSQTADLTIGTSLTLQGTGVSADETRVEFVNDDSFIITADDVTVRNIHLVSEAQFFIDVPHKGGVGTGQPDVLYENIIFDNIIVEGGRRSMWLHVRNLTVTNSEFRHSDDRQAIQVRAAQGTTLIADNTFLGGSASRAAIIFEGASDLITRGSININGNTANSHSQFVLFNLSGWEDIDEVRVLNNSVDHKTRSGSSIIFMFGDFAKIAEILIEGNTFQQDNSGRLAVYVDYRSGGSSIPDNGQIQVQNNLFLFEEPWGAADDTVHENCPVGFSTNEPIGMSLDAFDVDLCFVEPRPPPEVTVTKTSATTEVPETGGPVTYTFTVMNAGEVSFAITSLDDDQFGALAGDAGCEVGTELDPEGSCSFDAAFDVPAGTTGETFVNTFTAVVTDADDTTDEDSDGHTVTYTDDEPPDIITIESIPIPTISRIGLLFMLLLMMGTGLWFVRR